jgi:predicted nucleotidyltransferase
MEKEKLLLQTLFKSSYGSKLYGTDGPNSDMDIKYIFLPPLKNALLGKQVLKTKFVSPNEVDKSKQVDEDFIPIQKFATDFLKGVPYAIEIAFSPELSTRHVPGHVQNFLFKLKEKFLNKKLSGFLGFVNNIHLNLKMREDKIMHSVNLKPIDPKDVYHGLRVATEAAELLQTGKLTFPLWNASFLKEVKTAKVVNPSHYFAVLDNNVKSMEAALSQTSLQELTPELEEEFEQWLYEQLYSIFYNIGRY